MQRISPGGCAFMVTSIPMNLLCRNLGVKRASVAKLVDFNGWGLAEDISLITSAHTNPRVQFTHLQP